MFVASMTGSRLTAEEDDRRDDTKSEAQSGVDEEVRHLQFFT